MSDSPRSFNPPPVVLSRWREDGAALIVTLMFLLLISGLIVAFFSRTLLDNRLSRAASGRLETERTLYEVSELLTDQLVQEIRDPVFSTSLGVEGVNYFLPRHSDDRLTMLPSRSPATLEPESSDAWSPLLKVSAPDTPFSTIAPTTRTMATDSSTATPGLNGRSLGVDDWFGVDGPRFLASDDPNNDSRNIPTWCLITLGNGIGMRDGTGPGDPFTDDDLATLSDRNSPNYVTGRFAYAIYDLGGMLNINLAGHSPEVSAPASRRDHLSYLDLSGLSDALDALLTWRNPETGSNYLQEIDNPSAIGRKSGFTAIPAGDAAFVSRRDLLRYASDVVADAELDKALPYLTHFQYHLAAPSWTPPASPTNGNRNIFEVVFEEATSLTHYHSDGSTETYEIPAGRSLVQRRFPLERLQWFSFEGPTPDTSQIKAAIEACFGLKWNTSTSTWEYQASPPSGGIRTLDEVAALATPREPNFFEVLKAAILSGSLGASLPATGEYLVDNQPIDGLSDRQIFQIGANIIDQADEDNYPTHLSFTMDGIPLEIQGQEDLPMPYTLFVYSVSDGSGGGTATGHLLPSVWNPNQPSTSSHSPGEFRIRVASGTGQMILLRESGESGQSTIYSPGRDFSGQSFEFTADATAFRSGPGNTLWRPGFIIDSLLYPARSDPTKEDKRAYNYALEDVVIVLEYKAVDGTWRSYASFAGDPLLPGVGLQISEGYHGFGTIDQNLPLPGEPFGRFLMRPDPRTWRFGMGQGWSTGTTNRPKMTPTTPILGSSVSYYALRSDFGSGVTTEYGALWQEAGPPSPDGISRKPDGYLAGTDAHPMLSGTKPTAARPVVLQRPFLSVGELGVVYRGEPWKSLDLFSDTSADAALLDFFSIRDAPLHRLTTNGIGLNSLSPGVIRMFLNAFSKDPLKASDAIAEEEAASEAEALATALRTAPVANRSGLAGRLADGTLSTSDEKIKTRREASLRALADLSETRTWNVAIDITLQVGRYTPGSATLADFSVEGESRALLYLAIDRLTGKVLAKQLEPFDAH
ncbi:MAG TPA: hypothetical protein VNQ90_02125 [Chthoniobacteraceae bacterium]|nr:hypothetical protein [Chthoniobacteraceae bacterium]